MPPNSVAFLNLWADWNRSGAWGDASALTCGSTPVSEWAVQNFAVTLAGEGLYKVQLPTFLAFNQDVEKDIWLRLSLSDSPAPAADGRGPTGGYQLGETEDYRLEGTLPPVSIATPPNITPVEFTGYNPEASELYLSMVRGGTPVITAPPASPTKWMWPISAATFRLPNRWWSPPPAALTSAWPVGGYYTISRRPSR
jgi:hypothetical protein